MRNLFALVPVKDPALGKSRLTPILDDPERRRLNLVLARRTLEVCTRALGAARTLVVTSSMAVREIAETFGVRVVAERKNQQDLNWALSAAADWALRAGADGIVAVPTDLALLSEPLLHAALTAMPEAPGCVLVPDRRNNGTNLLGLSPARSDFFSFGEFSLQRHANTARRLGYEVRIHHCEALALDLDFPEDYIHLEKLKAWPTYESTIPKASPSRWGNIPTSHA
jgi:2-phospho-L-lactate guanylyltransferase